MAQTTGNQDHLAQQRREVCRMLGLAGQGRVHELIVEGRHKGPEWLLQRGLNAQNLTKLGYHVDGMHRLGYSDTILRILGYRIGDETVDAPLSRHDRSHEPSAHSSETNVDSLIKSGMRARELHDAGYTIHHCKRAGYSAAKLDAMGFPLDELSRVCTPAELRRADFKASELRHYFRNEELKRAGFSAAEMRLAGYSVRDLLHLGYNENHIRTAGFSHNELIREGVGRLTRARQH